jgi:hypothetical protein
MAILKSRAKTLRTKTLWTPVRMALLVLLALAVAPLPACFSPVQPGCAFSCAGDGICPSGYSCGGDLICHRNDGQGTCSIQIDAATDVASIDAKPDTTSDRTSDTTTDTKRDTTSDATSGQ